MARLELLTWQCQAIYAKSYKKIRELDLLSRPSNGAEGGRGVGAVEGRSGRFYRREIIKEKEKGVKERSKVERKV